MSSTSTFAPFPVVASRKMSRAWLAGILIRVAPPTGRFWKTVRLFSPDLSPDAKKSTRIGCRQLRFGGIEQLAVQPRPGVIPMPISKLEWKSPAPLRPVRGSFPRRTAASPAQKRRRPRDAAFRAPRQWPAADQASPESPRQWHLCRHAVGLHPVCAAPCCEPDRPESAASPQRLRQRSGCDIPRPSTGRAVTGRRQRFFR